MKKFPFYELIKTLCNQGEIVEFYSYSGENGHFAVGEIVDCSQDAIVIHAINELGFDDGFFLGRTHDICKISINTPYVDNIKRLYRMKKKTSCATNKAIDDKTNLLDAYIRCMLENKEIVTCSLYDNSCMTGYIEDFNNQIVKVYLLGEDGTFNGYTFFNAKDIETLSFMGLEEKRYFDILRDRGGC